MAPGSIRTSDSRLCGVRGVRAKATQPRPRRGAGTPPGTETSWAIKLCQSGKSDPAFKINEGPGPPRKAQVLLVPTAAAASFLEGEQLEKILP